MRLIKEITLAAGLSLAAICNIAVSHAAEIKLGQLVITQPWSRQPPEGANVAAGFVTITNSGSSDDRLLRASSAISDQVQLHEMKMDGGMMKMGELADGIAIAAGETVNLKPGSLHIMFIGLKSRPKAGGTFPVTLTFDRAGSIEAEFAVKASDAGMN
jgi:copper(I)-binding protein